MHMLPNGRTQTPYLQCHLQHPLRQLLLVAEVLPVLLHRIITFHIILLWHVGQQAFVFMWFPVIRMVGMHYLLVAMNEGLHFDVDRND